MVACVRGHELIGSEELTCGPDGQTKTENPDEYPECIYLPGPCDKPSIANGWVTYDGPDLEIPFRAETFVVCNQPNYGPTQTLVMCVGNNVWQPPIPECTWQGSGTEQNSYIRYLYYKPQNLRL